MSASPGPVPLDRRPDVVDLKSAREARQVSSAHWVCPMCDLVAAGFTPTECAYLAAVHDQVQHGSRQTARIVLGTPTAPASPASAVSEAATADFGIGA